MRSVGVVELNISQNKILGYNISMNTHPSSHPLLCSLLSSISYNIKATGDTGLHNLHKRKSDVGCRDLMRTTVQSKSI